jgi:hypothetical protein
MEQFHCERRFAREEDHKAVEYGVDRNALTHRFVSLLFVSCHVSVTQTTKQSKAKLRVRAGLVFCRHIGLCESLSSSTVIEFKLQSHQGTGIRRCSQAPQFLASTIIYLLTLSL